MTLWHIGFHSVMEKFSNKLILASSLIIKKSDDLKLQLAVLRAHAAAFSLLARRDLPSGVETQLWKKTGTHTETPWQTEVEKRNDKKKKQENSSIADTDKPTHSSAITSARLSSYGAVQRFTSHLLQSFFFLPRTEMKTERSGRPLTRRSRKCGTFSES